MNRHKGYITTDITVNDIEQNEKYWVQIWEILAWIKNVIPFRQSIILSGECINCEYLLSISEGTE